MRIRFRHLLTATTGLTFGLILLGVYTGAIGAGLSCAGRWPLCDGWLGLFPATWPSFVEWFHRFVAMITGFLILGTTVQAWRGDHEKRIRYGTALALGVLPVQVLLGANTVLNFGAIASTVHHAAALIIFASLVASTAWAFEAVDAPADADASVESGTDTESGSSEPVRL
jgi:cytochrome c oxidase assembly protein subunit 15